MEHGHSAMREDEAAYALARIPHKGRALEIGTLDGVTVSRWAAARPDVQFVSVDPFRRATGTGKGDFDNWYGNKKTNQSLFCGTMNELSLFCSAHVFDFAFVDGDHSRDGCGTDLFWCERAVKPGGLILVHDYGRTSLPHLAGVTVAVDYFVANYPWRIAETFRCIAVLKHA